MSTVRVLLLAHHHGNWRIIAVDKLQLGNAARTIQSSPPLGTRCITTTSQPEPGSTLVLAPRPTAMGLISFFTKRAMKNAEPHPTSLQCLDGHHVIPRPFAALPAFGSLHGQTEEPESPTPGTRLRSLSNFPYIVKREQDIKARRERIWSEIEKKASALGRKAQKQAYFLHGGQDQIEEVQTLCDEFNDVYDHFGSLIAELDDMINRHGESIRCDSACQAATAALVETMAQREQHVFEILSGNSVGKAGDADSSDYEDHEGPAEGRVTDQGYRQSSQPLRADTEDLIERTRSPVRTNAPRNHIPVLSPPNTAKQVRWSDGSDLASSPRPPSFPLTGLTDHTPYRRPIKRLTSSRHDSKHNCEQIEANISKSRT
ncbi:hypothetical protein AC578_9180 [Pseudocercospora eumusae]|uniref:Uncharacterized protein n=1 Tax=Pseudocercospora eumusae TaxID=321146 RepID=A0A139HV05_9PEZI|nr:hypothetical protein AC578_9180 [Pseudocercospora eumusae]